MNDPIGEEAAIPGDMKSQCRCCLWKLKKNLMSQDIFELWAEEENSGTTIAAEMAKIANVEIADIEGYPRRICFKCLDRLKSAIPLVKDIRKTQAILRSRLSSVEHGTDETWPKPIDIDRSLSEDVLRNSTDMEIKEEVVSDEECRDEDVEMEDALAEPEIKVEPEEMVEQPAIQVTVNDSSYDDGEVDLLDVIEAKTSKRNISHLNESIGLNFTFDDFIINKKIFKSSISLGPKCNCKCYRDCGKLSQEQRQFIFDYFWGSEITIQQQCNFLINFTERKTPRQRTAYSLKSRREITFYYFLPIDKTLSTKVKVCKTMFVNTIGTNSECPKRIWNLYDRLQMSKNNKYKNLKKARKPKHEATAKKIKPLINRDVKGARCLKRTKAFLTSSNKKDKSKRIKPELSELCDELKNTIKRARVVLPRIDDEIIDQVSSKISEIKDEATPREMKPDVQFALNEENKVESYVNQESQKDLDACLDYEYLEDDNDLESKCSNFSEEFRELVEEEASKSVIQENKPKDEDFLCSEDETSSDDSIVFQTKKEKLADRFTRRNPDPSFVNNEKQLIKNEEEREAIQFEIENMDEILTDKLKRPTKDREIIMNYRKNRGWSYVKRNGDIVPKKKLGPPCNCLKMKCESKISQEQRQNIFDHFWSLGDRKKQKSFVLKFSAKVKTSVVEAKRNGFSIKYYLPLTNKFDEAVEKVRVCKKMFLNTIAARQSYTNNIWHKIPVSKPENNSRDTSNKVQKYDNTLIDFVYRAMPFDEFMSHFSTKKEPKICEDASEAGVATVKKPINRKRLMLTKKRLKGKRYMTPKGKIVGEKVIGPPCNCPARKCTEKISQEQREYVFRYYWNIEDIAKKRAFLVRFTAREGIQRRTVNSRRENTFRYFLPITHDFDGEKIQVCKKMFVNTLAILGKVIKKAWEKYAQGSLESKVVLSKYYFSKIDKSTANSAIDHFNSLKEIDPELTKFMQKTKSGNFLMYRKIYQLYDSWFDPTKYTDKVSNAQNYRRIVEGQYHEYLEKFSNDLFY